MIVPWARVRTIVSLSLPIVLILLSQTLMGLISIAMVSHLGDTAVAGIGIGGALFSVLMAVLFGIGDGSIKFALFVQALIGAGTAAGVATIGRRLYGVRAGWIAGVIYDYFGFYVNSSGFGRDNRAANIAAVKRRRYSDVSIRDAEARRISPDDVHRRSHRGHAGRARRGAGCGRPGPRHGRASGG